MTCSGRAGPTLRPAWVAVSDDGLSWRWRVCSQRKPSTVLGTILLIVLVLVLPTWGHGRSWG